MALCMWGPHMAPPLGLLRWVYISLKTLERFMVYFSADVTLCFETIQSQALPRYSAGGGNQRLHHLHRPLMLS